MSWTTTSILVLVLLVICTGIESGLSGSPVSVSITRHHKGDTFMAQDTDCYEDLCLGMSSGTASSTDATGCNCQCMPNLPIFRDDLQICVDDIQECTLAPFVSGTTTQKIPYVFLPLKRQIVYPSAEIVVSAANPICVVSGAQFLGRRGWIHLRNNTDTDLPFRLFRDEGRTYLQWLGEADLRLAMEGRLIMVHLMCKDASGEEHKIFTPCIAFRVAGNPSGIREMLFASDKNISRDGDRSLSVSEYVTIGVCILLLGLIYVASVFLYLYFRKKKRKEKENNGSGSHLAVAEEGIVKSNPLLQATRRHLAAVAGQDNVGYNSDSGSCCSESERCSDIILPEEDLGTNSQNIEISATVHPYNLEFTAAETLINQDSSNIEKLPEEDVSIVETLEGKEERPETVRTMGTAYARRKLYFNPAYFELDLLKAPPPAALEFLAKIREVIAIAKHKMSAKRFSPSLIGIPEEESYGKTGKPSSVGNRSRPASVVSYSGSAGSKRSRKSQCLTCVENEIGECHTTYNIATTHSCCHSDTKQRIIRKWLEDVPFVKSEKIDEDKTECYARSKKVINPESGVATSLSRNGMLKNEASSVLEREKAAIVTEIKKPPAPPQRKETKKPSTKGPAPPRPPPPPFLQAKINAEGPKKSDDTKMSRSSSFSNAERSDSNENHCKPPPLPAVLSVVSKVNVSAPAPPHKPSVKRQDSDEVPRVQGKDKVPPVVAKTLMDAVIKEMIVQRKNERSGLAGISVNNNAKKKSNMEIVQEKNIRNEQFLNGEKTAFEIDSLERKTGEADTKNCLADDVSGDDDKPRNSGAEEINSHVDGNLTSVGPSGTLEKPAVQDDHDYEVILLNPAIIPQEPEDKELKIYNLPELLSKNDRGEGYSLVSEVYVNDGYSYSSDGSTSHSNNSDSCKSGKGRTCTGEKPGRLTIHVKDSPDNYRHVLDESESFEPDTLERKLGKSRYTKSGEKWDSGKDQYSNQRFHEMGMDCKHSCNGNGNEEHFIDSLERPRISLKTTGSFRKSPVQADVDRLINNLQPPLAKHFGSLREIYEAKARSHRRRTETTSLVGSIPSDIDCNSTLSWREDRRNKLLHRGIILHMSDESKKPRRHKGKSCAPKINYPDVIPPRPPKPSSLTGTPNQNSGVSTPGSLSHCPSPTPRSGAASPAALATHFPHTVQPPTPPRFSQGKPRVYPSPPHSGRASPARSTCITPPPPPRSKCSSPIVHSGRCSPSKSLFPAPPPPPRSTCTSPTSPGRSSPNCLPNYIPPPPKVTSCVKSFSANRRSPSPSQFLSNSPAPPPKPAPLSNSNSPPLPPRSCRPPLPPKNSKGTRQRKSTESLSGRRSSNLARRPLPPVPSPRHYLDSTLSSVSSRDLETLSTLSGASIDSLNSSDYEAFYTLPYDGSEGEIYDPTHLRMSTGHKNAPIFGSNINPGTEVTLSADEDNFNGLDRTVEVHDKGRESSRSKRSSESVKSWRKVIERNGKVFPHKPEDSGYLSTDSESGKRCRPKGGQRSGEHQDIAGSQGSETEESLCDGASESGAESIATDSFFFGNFHRAKMAESIDSPVGSEVNKGFVRTLDMMDPNDSESKNRDNESRGIMVAVHQ